MGKLFDRPKFVVKGKGVVENFEEALAMCGAHLTVDYGALTSYFTYGFVTGDRTIFREISRLPWMSSDVNGDLRLDEVPAHGLKKYTISEIGDRLFELLCEEVASAVRNKQNIYILLSGGLDSRIVAGILGEMFKQGKLPVKPVALTWGMANSRDVILAKEVADLCDLGWEHLEINSATVMRNVRQSPMRSGMIHSPELLHAFLEVEERVEEGAVILAGSYGDSMGRGEFMGKHLLNLNPMLFTDPFKILDPRIRKVGQTEMTNDLNDLRLRSTTSWPWAFNEIFMQGYRMRNGLSHALVSGKKDVSTVQLFTSEDIVKFIWSIHPVLRGDAIYEYVLENKLKSLSKVQWARTLRRVDGSPSRKNDNLRKEYHDYTNWSRVELRSELESIIDLNWFASKGVFNTKSISRLRFLVASSRARFGRMNEFWLFLAGFRLFLQALEESGRTIIFEDSELRETRPVAEKASFSFFGKVYLASRFPFLSNALKALRARSLNRKQAQLKMDLTN